MSQNNTNSDEITFGQLMLRMKDVLSYLLNSWKKFVFISLLFAGLGFGASLFLKPKYKARLSFVIEESKAESPLAAYSNIASQFGFDMGGSGSNAFSEDNLAELLRSRKIVEEALLNKNDSTILVNHFIASPLNKWKDEEELSGINFTTDRANFTKLQDSILFEIYTLVIKKYLTVKNISPTSSILLVECVSKDEYFSKNLVENLMKSVSDFYISNKTQRARETLTFIKERTDSIAGALAGAELRLARFKDSFKQIIKAEGYLEEIKLTRDVQILNLMYGEAVKNLELSKVTLLSQTPLLQVIDEPILPLEIVKLTIPKGIIIGGLLGFFFALVWLVVKKLIHDSLTAEA